MKIDQAALAAASTALANIHQYNGPNEETDADALRIIEAYETAKPAPECNEEALEVARSTYVADTFLPMKTDDMRAIIESYLAALR